MTKRLMLAVWFVVVVLALGSCRAEAQCLWLNAATAGGVLGGEVEMSVTALTTAGDETCEFTRTEGTMSAMLRIEVHTMGSPAQEYGAMVSRCGGGTVPLRRIGNEAVQCFGTVAAEERVIGRVRDRVFVLTVRRKPLPIAGKEPLRDDTRNTAEQIAGSLF